MKVRTYHRTPRIVVLKATEWQPQRYMVAFENSRPVFKTRNGAAWAKQFYIAGTSERKARGRTRIDRLLLRGY
jgi:hypothetical protein